MADDNVYGTLIDQSAASAASAQTLVDQATPSPTPNIATPAAAPAPMAIAAPAEPADYGQIIDSQKSVQAQSLRQSVYAAKDLNPDRHAKVMALAAEMKLPPNVVDRQYDNLVKSKQAQQTDYDRLIEENPKFSQWLEDPNNAAIAKNDMAPLKDLEDQVNNQGFSSTFLNLMGYTLSSVGTKIGALPGLAYDTLMLPANAEAARNTDLQKRFGVNPQDLADLEEQTDGSGRPVFNSGSTEQFKTPDMLAKNPISDLSKFAQNAYKQQLPQLSYSVVQEARGGNYHKAAVGMLIQAAAGAPDLIGAIGLGMVNPALGAAFFGASSAASTSDELRDQGVDPASATTAALAHGVVAAGAGEIRILDWMKPWEHAISNQFGKQVSSEIFKDMFKTLVGTAGVQGGTGAAMSLADDMADYVTGVNPNALHGTFERAIDAGAVGTFTGLALAGPSSITAGLARQQQIHQTNALRDFYLSFGKTAEATKLRQNLPEAQRQFVEQVTRDTPVENVYVDPEKLDTYFQSKNLNPTAVMQEMGILPAYGAAKETGNDVKIPLSTLVDKLVGTEHYAGIADDIKFQPDGMSVNDHKVEDARLKAEADAAKEQAPTMPEDSSKEVGRTVADQLGALGVDDRQAKIYEAAFKTLGERMGMDPLELFNQYKLSITGPEAPPAEGAEFKPAGSENEQNLRILNQAKFETEGLPNNVIDSADRFTKSRENTEEMKRQADETRQRIEEQTKFLGDKINSISDNGKEMLSALAARFGGEEKSAKIEKAIKGAQRADAGPYVSDKNIPGMGFAPNYAAEPTGVIGPDRISQPAEVSDWKSKSRKFTDKETDPFKWSDTKYGATKELIAKHQAENKPLVINTSSDLVAHADYIAVMPDDTTVRLHMPTTADELNRSLFPGNPSRKRLEMAAEKLRDAGIKVEEINPTFDDVVNSVGGEKAAEKLVGPDWAAQIKAATEKPSVKIPKLVLLQDGEDTPKGQIKIGENSINIQLLKDADRSTFIHETGHFYLEVLKDLASKENAPDQIKNDFATIQKWLGAEGQKEFHVEQHEQFARGFEAYLMEGKAPSEGLRKAFSAFKVWLTNIYKTIKNLKVELTPEVRGVFDRILSTDAEIAQAEGKQNYDALFKEPAKYNLSAEDFAKYQSAIDSAKLAANDELRAKLMHDITQEQTALYKEQRENIRQGVESEVNQSKTYKTRNLLQFDELPDGSHRPEGTPKLKIDRQSLVDQFGKEILKDLPRMYSREEGMDVGLVADLMGFSSADDMVSELANSIPKNDYIEQQTDARMKDLHPDLFGSPEVPDAAMAAIHNDKRAAVMRMELEFLAKENMSAVSGLIKKIARRVPTDKQIREQATGVVGNLNVRELSPNQYRSAEARHAREAGENLAKGDFDAAFDSKRLELYNHELYKAAVEAKEDVQKSLKLFKKVAITDEKASKSRDVDLVSTAKAVLAAFGIGKPDVSPATILDKIKRYDSESYASAHALVEMATAAGSGNYNEIPYTRFKDMRDAVKGIWDLARDSKRLEIDGKKVDRDEILKDLKAKIVDFGPNQKPPGYDQAMTRWDKTKTVLMSAKAVLRRPEHWVTAMDGGDKGSFRTYIWNPISDAAVQFRLAKDKMVKHYLNEVVLPSKEIFNKKSISAPEIGYTFKNKSELLGAMLHTGNESNYSKLLRGRKWGNVDENNNVDSTKFDQFVSRMHDEGVLTKGDYDYLQGVWDMYEMIKPDAQKAHKKINGYYFDEVTHKPFQTPFGEYKGGYAPAIVDPYIAQDAQLRADKAIIDNEASSLMFPTAGSGFTKSRVEAYAGPLSLDLNLIPMQLDKVLRFTYMEPAVKDVYKLLNNRDFRETMNGLDSQVISEMLVPWLDRSAKQSVSSPTGTGRAWKAADYIFRKIRSNAGLNAMTLNVVNTFHQTTGLSVAAVKVEPEYLRDATWNYVRDAKNMAEAIHEKSDYMRARESEVGKLQGEIDDLMLHPNKFQKASDFVKQNSYILQKMTAGAVETVVWSGAYSKGLAEGYTDTEAVRYADSVIRQTQHAAAPEDVARFGTGSPFARIFTMYFDYYNNKANLGATEAGNMIREAGVKKSAGGLIALYVSGMMIPAMLSAAAYEAAKGDLFDDGSDPNHYMHMFLKIFFGGQANELTAYAPVVGPLINNQVNRWNSNSYDDRLQLSPAIENFQKAFNAPREVYEAAFKHGQKGPAIRDTLSLLGTLSGLPLQPLAKPIGYAADAAAGKVRVHGPLDYARGLVTGQGPRQ